MSKTVEIQIEKSRGLVEGLRRRGGQEEEFISFTICQTTLLLIIVANLLI